MFIGVVDFFDRLTKTAEAFVAVNLRLAIFFKGGNNGSGYVANSDVSNPSFFSSTKLFADSFFKN